MAAGGAKPNIPHRNKPTPKKGEAKTLKRKRGQEDLGKLKAAIEELVSRLSCRGLPSCFLAVTNRGY